MSTLYLYRDDYIENPRDTEGSNKVARLWYDERVRYADEDISDDQCMGIVAERLIVRRLLGMEKLDMAYMSKASRAKPFGSDAPMLAELLMPGTFIAMALIPLSPQGSQGRPIVARLYCVSGLSDRYELPLEGMNEEALQGFSWFLAGVPQALLRSGVAGRSWLLAANLLARVVRQQDIKTARNLAKHYIVTGDVSDGVIRKVEMLRKPELAKQFDNFKWIIPKENDMDMPKRKIEKPATLDEAYQLIESMRSTATRSFFRFLREGNLAGIKEQYRIGADIFAREEKTDLTCLEVVAYEKARLYAPSTAPKKEDEMAVFHPESLKKNIRDRIAKFDKITLWLRQQGADSAIMFFLMAINGDETGIVSCSKYCQINACDEHGLTAVDLALEKGEFDAAKLLHRCGGAPNVRWHKDSKLRCAIDCFCDPIDPASRDQIKLIVAAIDAGLSPEMRIELNDPSEHYHSIHCSLYAVAVRYAQYDVLEACLRNGADPNETLNWTADDGTDPFTYETIESIILKGTPWSILSKRNDMKGETRQKFRELLQKHGAQIDEA